MATKANLVVDQGADFSTSITVTNDDGGVISLSGYTGAAQMRKHYTSTTATNFTVTIDEDLGKVVLSLSSTQTANLTPGRYVYDCELRSSGNTVSRVLEGIVTVTPEVTR